MDLQNLTMMLPSHLGWPLSLKTPNIGNTGLKPERGILLFTRPLLQNRTFLIFTGIWIALFVIVIAISGSSGDSETPTTSTKGDVSETSADGAPTMIATVQILPGVIQIINENDFIWYGIIVTVGDGYSTKRSFNNPDFGWLHANSEVVPNEDYAPAFSAYLNENGEEWEGEIRTIILTDVKLEAKSQPFGDTYDLESTFKFSRKDPILGHYVARTNKPTDGKARATPYALTEAIERRPRILIHGAGDTIFLEHHEPQYDEIMAIVSKHPQNALGNPVVPPDTFRQVQSMLLEGKRLRWKEHYDHWGTVNAFTEAAHEITADTIVDPQELILICATYPQWQNNMSIVKEWLEDYREFDPEQAKDPSITNLEVKVDGILELLATSLESCEEMREDG